MEKKYVHILFWSAYIALNTFLEKFTLHPKSFYLSDQVAKRAIAVLFFYFVVWILFRKSRFITKALLFILSVFVYYGLSYVTYKYILPTFFAFGYPDLIKLNSRFFASGIWWWLHFSIYAYFYWLYHKNINTLKSLNLLQQKNIELESAKIKSDYNFLKAQINPHFLYNTLSFFYSKIFNHDKKTADGIALLTDIMRYSLQQGEADGKVELEDEVTHLNNYICLQQMRFNNTLNIRFEKNIEPEHYRILPHIFITLVENAFKHGEVNNPMHPLRIALGENEEQLVFTVHNKIRNGPKDGPSTGVGLKNIETRLKMEYGKATCLQSNSVNDFFTVSLSIPLKLLEKKNMHDEHKKKNKPVSINL